MTTRPRFRNSATVLSLLLLAAAPAAAETYEFGEEMSLEWRNRVSLGAAWRMEGRNPALIGKLSLDPNLCDGSDCRDFGGDLEPNQRLVDAPGGLAAHNQDNGNLNYDKRDMVFANAQWSTELTYKWADFTAYVKGQGTFDAVNYDFEESHPNTRHQPAKTPRSKTVANQIGKRADLLEGWISYPFQLGERAVRVAVGEQRIRWGEANTIQLNSIGEINPPDQNLLFFPGVELVDVFRPVGMITVETDITDTLALELVYQYRWEPIRPAAAGSFLSTSDIAGGGDYAVISEGQFPEDPFFTGTPQGTLGLLSSTSFSVPMLPEKYGEPRDRGQYGFALRGFLPDFIHGTEWGLYYLNYHSRVPYGSVISTDASCWRESRNFAEALIDCRGFNGSINPTGLGLEPVPIGTLKVFLDYPEDIQMYGVSFNTTLGLWSFAGEYSFRPNLPVQVQLQDVVFAGVNPVFPRVELPIPGVATIPTAAITTPDYIETRYRGNPNIQPNTVIRGYERLKVGQMSITGLRVFSSSNLFAADQILLLAEAGFTHVVDMPGLDQIQFDGGGANATHASPGADGTGAPPDSRRTVPTQQTDDFAEAFAWGYRMLARVEYNNVAEWAPVVRPLLGIFHDVKGVSVSPVQNFIEGRKQFLVGAQVEFDQKLSAQAVYQIHSGGGSMNKLSDRDHLALSVIYSF